MDIRNRKAVIACYQPNSWLLPVILAGVDRHLPQYGVEIVTAREGQSWGERMHNYCNCHSLPFLLLLEDYALVDSNHVLLAEAWRHSHDFGCVRLIPCPGPAPTQSTFGPIYPETDYSVSLQASIWRPDALLSVITTADSPWDVEIAGTRRYAATPKYMTNCCTTNAVSYCNILRCGHIVPAALAEAETKLEMKVEVRR